MKTELITVPTFVFPQGKMGDHNYERPIHVDFYNGCITLRQDGEYEQQEQILIMPDQIEALFREIKKEIMDSLTKQSIRLNIERLNNELLDALDLKQGNGPTALSMLKSELDRVKEQKAESDKPETEDQEGLLSEILENFQDYLNDQALGENVRSMDTFIAEELEKFTIHRHS